MSQYGWVQPDFKGVVPQNPTSMSKVKKRGVFVAKDTSSTKRTANNEDMYVNRYRASKASELVVQKKKVTEVKEWLEQSFKGHNEHPPLLLLTGPPGCGKYQTITLLCQELGIETHQWEEPIRYQTNVEWEYKQNLDYEERLMDMNPMCHLADFMSRTNRYSMLNLKGSHSTLVSQKLLLIKDFPAMVYTNSDKWQQLLIDYCLKGKTPAVFILTEGNTNYGLTMKLFPANLQEKLCMTSISVNSLANTLVTKALERVMMLEKKSLPSNCQLSHIVESSNGDLRSALNTLQWMSQGSGSLNYFATKSKKRKLVSPESKSVIKSHSRDGSLDFMHALGKVLYSKRSNSVYPDGELPAHLVEEMRLPLQENLDLLVHKIGESSSKVLLYLHQNYPPFFSRIEDIARATHHMSSAEMFSNKFFNSNENAMEDYALMTSVRGLMHSNTCVTPNCWRPLKKPEYYQVQQKQRDLTSDAQELWPFRISDRFFSERLPYLQRMINTYSWTPGQTRFLQQSRIFRPNGYLDQSGFVVPSSRQAISNQRPIFRVPRNPDTAIRIESNVVHEPAQEDEEIVIEEYED